MLKSILLGLFLMCVFNVIAHAEPDPREPAPSSHKEPLGMGMGAVIGGLIAGPPGAIIGAAGGALMGARAGAKDSELAGLEQRLAQRETEFAELTRQFADIRNRHDRELRRVSLERRRSALRELTEGVSLTVYFRTGSAGIDPEFVPRIRQLATFLRDFPEIRLQLEGHADRRGTPAYNQRLSEQRAGAVQQVLIDAGLPGRRLRSHAYGESQALSAEGDREGYVFDRRVNINLTLHAEA